MTASTNTIIFAILLIAVLVAVIAWVSVQRRRSLRLRKRFGPEYDLAVSHYRSRSKAETELLKREQRAARLTIVPLTSADAFRFSQAWNTLQGRFIDSPKGVVAEADHLVRELMAKRGYPMGDFERMAADLSVHHPGIVPTYRAAQAIAARDARGEADTEELRKSLIYYRTLFDELLGVAPEKLATEPSATGIPVHS
ncbi:MAG TPA: hypothetical protein VHW95_08420 [Steroidobacteraceae bacterium]|jgi:hypothetical protein|nr:hypothetical protein [Steroidobacteraceae bacterium]